METGGREEKMSKMAVRLLQQARNTAGSLLTRLDAGQLSKEIRSTMPFLIPFLKMTTIYFVLLLDNGTFPAAVVKCLPILSLIWFVCLVGVSDPVQHEYNRLIVTALSWSCAGDFFLVWADLHIIYFLLGLGCFAVGHFVYSLAFGWRPFGVKEFLFSFSTGIPVLSGIVCCVDGVLKYATAIYGLLLLVMAWRALARFNLRGKIPWRKIYAAIGAVLFVISDLVLAVNKFCQPVAGERYIIMTTYYAAQFFIALSVVNSMLLSPSATTNGQAAVVTRDDDNDKKNGKFPLNRTSREDDNLKSCDKK